MNFRNLTLVVIATLVFGIYFFQTHRRSPSSESEMTNYNGPTSTSPTTARPATLPTEQLHRIAAAIDLLEGAGPITLDQWLGAFRIFWQESERFFASATAPKPDLTEIKYLQDNGQRLQKLLWSIRDIENLPSIRQPLLKTLVAHESALVQVLSFHESKNLNSLNQASLRLVIAYRSYDLAWAELAKSRRVPSSTQKGLNQ